MTPRISALLLTCLAITLHAFLPAQGGRETTLTVGHIVEVDGLTIQTSTGDFEVTVPTPFVVSVGDPPNGTGVVIRAKDDIAVKFIEREIRKHYETIEATFVVDNPNTAEIESSVAFRPNGILMAKGPVPIHLPKSLVRRTETTREGILLIPQADASESDIILRLFETAADRASIGEAKQLIEEQLERDPENALLHDARINLLRRYESTNRPEVLFSEMRLLDLLIPAMRDKAWQVAERASVTSRELGDIEVNKGGAGRAAQYFIFRSLLAHLSSFPDGSHRTFLNFLFLNGKLPQSHATIFPSLLFLSLHEIFQERGDSDLLLHNLALGVEVQHGETLRAFMESPGQDADWTSVMPLYFHYQSLLFIEDFPGEFIPPAERVATIQKYANRIGALLQPDTVNNPIPVRHADPNAFVSQEQYIRQLSDTPFNQHMRSLALTGVYSPMGISFYQLFLMEYLIRDPETTPSILGRFVSAGRSMLRDMAAEVDNITITDPDRYRRTVLRNLRALAYLHLQAPTFDYHVDSDEAIARVQVQNALEFANSDIYADFSERARNSMTVGELEQVHGDMVLLVEDNVGPRWRGAFEQLSETMKSRASGARIGGNVVIASDQEELEARWRNFADASESFDHQRIRSKPPKGVTCYGCGGSRRNTLATLFGVFTNVETGEAGVCQVCKGFGYLSR